MEKMAHFFSFKTARNGWISGKTLIFPILFIAAFLRLYRISEYMTFLGDEGRDALWVYGILHGNFTLLGPTASVGGFFLGPIYYYFMAPFLWLFQYNPVGPAVMVGLFGVLTVWLVYKIGTEFFSPLAGISASLLYAVSPIVIAYSRSSWNPNLMPFFSLITLYLVYKGIEKEKRLFLLIAGVFFGIAMQLHYLATFLGIVVALYIFLSRLVRNVSLGALRKVIREYILFFVGFLIGWSPFLTFEVRHGFPNLISIFNFILHSGNVSGSSFLAIIDNVFFRLFGRLVTRFPPPEQVSLQAHGYFALWYLLTFILAVVSVFVLIWICNKTLAKKNEKFLQYGLLLTWFFVGIFLFGFYKKPIYDYYFGFMFPLPFLLVGNALSFLWNKQTILKIISAGTFVVLIILNLQGLPFRNSPNRQLAQVKQIAEFVVDKTNGKQFNFALITGSNSDHGYRYFMKLLGRDPVVIQNEMNDPKRTTVTDVLLIVCEDPNCQPLGNPLWEVAGFGRAEIAGHWNVSVVQVYKLIHFSP